MIRLQRTPWSKEAATTLHHTATTVNLEKKSMVVNSLLLCSKTKPNVDVLYCVDCYYEILYLHKTINYRFYIARQLYVVDRLDCLVISKFWLCGCYARKLDVVDKLDCLAISKFWLCGCYVIDMRLLLG